MKHVVLALFALTLGACAAASKPGAMVPELTNETIIKEASALRETVSVGTVGGGKETNPLWTSEVSNTDFAEALRQSFAAHAMLATETGVYRLDAELVELKQPFAGFNMTVTSIVNYTLTNVETDEVVLEETISEAYTAKAGDAFVGVKRLQLANEGSIKSNISSLIALMIDRVDGAADAPAEEMMDKLEETVEDATS